VRNACARRLRRRDRRAGCRPSAEFLGVPPSDIGDQSADIHSTARSCGFARHDDPQQSVLFTLERAESVEEAAGTYAQMKDSIAIADNVQTSAGVETKEEGAFVEILGLGDEALWTRVNGALTVRYRNLSIIVMSPGDRATQTKVAQKVLELLNG
jgi:hypothetical protein